MIHFFRALFALALAAGISAQALDDFSFGHKQGVLSPNSFGIPNWSMLGEGNVPHLLSDRVILTPSVDGNRKGALWTEKKNELKEWSLHFEFRVGAADRGSGSLQLWYVKDGSTAVSTSSVNTVGKFDGLLLLVDTNQGMQKIRGFLNDGTVEYKTHANIDGLAFGHCNYQYRNLGRPSRLSVISTANGLDVRIDDMNCFSTPKVILPPGYNFGITAASGDPPDSFEVFKFALAAAAGSIAQQQQRPNSQEQAHPQQIQQNVLQADDKPASEFTTSQAQFEDLHNRLNLLSKSITNLFSEITKHTQAEEGRYQEILSRMPNGQLINNLDNRVSNLDRMITNLERELKASDHNKQFAKLSEQIQRTHEGVTEHVPARLREYVIAHTPRIGFILYSFMAFQTVCIGGFVWYKYRKNTLPKKYL